LIRRTRQVTRRKFPAEEKIRIVMEGIRGEVAVSELCRREGIHPTIYYKWLKDFMEAGKGWLQGGTRSARPRPKRFVSCARRMSGSSSWWRS
jgi:transposase